MCIQQGLGCSGCSNVPELDESNVGVPRDGAHLESTGNSTDFHQQGLDVGLGGGVGQSLKKEDLVGRQVFVCEAGDHLGLGLRRIACAEEEIKKESTRGIRR